jgi:hypothetical protein
VEEPGAPRATPCSCNASSSPSSATVARPYNSVISDWGAPERGARAAAQMTRATTAVEHGLEQHRRGEECSSSCHSFSPASLDLVTMVNGTGGNRASSAGSRWYQFGPVPKSVRFSPPKPCLQIPSLREPVGFTGKPARFVSSRKPVGFTGKLARFVSSRKPVIPWYG